MKRSVQIALAAGGLAVFGGIFLAGASLADAGFGPPGPHMAMMGGMGAELLQNVDKNGDGALSQDEINAAVDGRFAEFDANKDGKLSLEEFQALWADLTRPIAVRAFQFLDPNGDAALDRAEVDKRFGSIVARLDRNNDGKLSPEDRPHDMRWHHGWKDGRADNPEE